MKFEDLIRSIPDYPKPGIVFRDITTLLGHAAGFRAAVDKLVEHYNGHKVDLVAGIEARGFIIGGAMAHRLGVGFVPIRKKGKLPWTTIGQKYELEYGSDEVEVHADAVGEGQRILIADDLIATGGTARAAAQLIRRSGGVVVAACFMVELPDIGGRRLLTEIGVEVEALCRFEGE